MKYLSNSRYFVLAVLGILLFKTFLMLWAAHPFDFWAFVNTIQRHTSYGWNMFEFWNKGNLLILLWYPLYALQLSIFSLFPSLTVSNVLLLHFFFKLPLFFSDVLIAYLIYRIVSTLRDVSAGRVAVIAWLLNPLTVYSYVIHGHYEIVTVLGFALILYGLICESWVTTALGFVIGIQLRYFFIVFGPFVFLYLLCKRKFLQLFYFSLAVAVGLFISYLQLLFTDGLAEQTLHSVLNLAHANAPAGITVLKVPPINIFSVVHSIFSPYAPITNVANPVLFSVANKGLFFIAFLLVVHFLARTFVVYRKGGLYSAQSCIIDIFFASLYFPLFLTNFQEHYLLWMVPMYITLVFARIDRVLLTAFSLFTIIGFNFAFRGELGIVTYFLDVITPQALIGLTNTDIVLEHIEGGIIIATIIVTFLILSRTRAVVIDKVTTLDWNVYFGLIVISWSLILMPYFQVLYTYHLEPAHPQRLAFRRDKMNDGALFVDYQVKSVDNNKVIFNDHAKSGSLLLSTLGNIPTEAQQYFVVYVLSSTTIEMQARKPKLNECVAQGYSHIENLVDGKEYSAAKFDVKCLKEHENTVELASNNLDASEMRLYVKNEPTGSLFAHSLRREITLAGIVGVLYLAIILSGVYFLLYRLQIDQTQG